MFPEGILYPSVTKKGCGLQIYFNFLFTTLTLCLANFKFSLEKKKYKKVKEKFKRRKENKEERKLER